MALLAVMTGYAQSSSPTESPAAYKERITKWRAGIEADLKTKRGWLSVAGLIWLKEGDNSVGSDKSCTVGLPARAPAHVGTIVRHGNAVSMTAGGAVAVTADGAPVGDHPVSIGSSDVKIGDLEFVIIRRGDRIGVRLYDPQSRAQKEFKGEKWYPVDPSFVIRAKYTAYETPKSMNITNVIGDTAPVSNPGYVTFSVGGKECRLEAQAAGDGFFFNFRDMTSGKTTYPAGRFLDATTAKDGYVTLDFNQATNPPCAFTAFATCPLPPRSNDLAVAIPAGEKTHHPPGE